MRSLFFFPPLPRLSGGMAVIADLARILAASGHNAALVVRRESRRGTGGSGPVEQLARIAPGVPVLDWEDMELTQEDRWIVPEGWPAALGPGLAARASCLLYVQNWAYLHGQLPQGTLWRDLPVRLLAVSEPVAWFIRETTGYAAPILRPAIDPACFHPAPTQEPAVLPASSKTVRVAWMPRKNSALARQIRDIFEARAGLWGRTAVEWIEIRGRPRQEVAALLRSSHVFLATGFPEGCPLPPLEALASGCLLAGFGGFGGWDYMRQGLPGGFLPWWPIRETPWGANGFFAADADVTAAALALEHAVSLLLEGGEELAALRRAGQQTAAWYSPERQRQTLLGLWEQEKFWKA